jgi:hypothetical protein
LISHQDHDRFTNVNWRQCCFVYLLRALVASMAIALVGAPVVDAAPSHGVVVAAAAASGESPPSEAAATRETRLNRALSGRARTGDLQGPKTKGERVRCPRLAQPFVRNLLNLYRAFLC